MGMYGMYDAGLNKIEYYLYDGNMKKHLPECIYSYDIVVQEDGTAILEEGGFVMRLILDIDNECWVVHCEDGPAVQKGNMCLFFIHGFNFKIEDLPIDDEVKVILKLKYSMTSDNGVVSWYV